MGGIFLYKTRSFKNRKENLMRSYCVECQFIEDCFAANKHCTTDLQKSCYQAEIMAEKITIARNTPCPICPGLKCDLTRMRALLSDPRECLLNGKCIVREKIPNIPAYKFDDWKTTHPLKLDGLINTIALKTAVS